MEQMEEALKDAILSHFPDAEVSFEHHEGYEGILGTVVRDVFVGRSQLDRQTELWTALRSDLSPEQQSEIGLLMTVTHAELNAIIDRAA